MRRLFVALVLIVLMTFVLASYVKNVIYFIGDGMGFNHVYLASILE
jgi:Alkaline phosphatase